MKTHAVGAAVIGCLGLFSPARAGLMDSMSSCPIYNQDACMQAIWANAMFNPSHGFVYSNTEHSPTRISGGISNSITCIEIDAFVFGPGDAIFQHKAFGKVFLETSTHPTEPGLNWERTDASFYANLTEAQAEEVNLGISEFWASEDILERNRSAITHYAGSGMFPPGQPPPSVCNGDDKCCTVI